MARSTDEIDNANNEFTGWLRQYALHIIVVIVISIIFLFMGMVQGSGNESKKIEADLKAYPFLATRLFTSQQDDMIINFTQLREVMNQRYREKQIPLGVYFEYLPTGASIGVNDQLQVEIGSLSKVPAVMAVYKEIERGTMKPSDLITIKEGDLDDRFGDVWKRGVGAKLTVEEAIDLTLRKSDNTAANVLASALPEGALQDVFDELDLPRTRTGPFPVMSPKSYSSVFRTLFLSAYLEENSSQEILADLTKTDFSDKLPSGIPSGVAVAHKIGVFRVKEVQDIFSDCGIVYQPKRPYVLCVMVAADEDTARTEIQAYAKMVHSYVSQVKASKVLSE